MPTPLFLMPDLIHDGLVGRLGKTALQPRSFIFLKPFAEPFRAVVEGIAKRLVDTAEDVSTSQKHLNAVQHIDLALEILTAVLTPGRSGLPFQRPLSRLADAWPQRLVDP